MRRTPLFAFMLSGISRVLDIHIFAGAYRAHDEADVRPLTRADYAGAAHAAGISSRRLHARALDISPPTYNTVFHQSRMPIATAHVISPPQ